MQLLLQSFTETKLFASGLLRCSIFTLFFMNCCVISLLRRHGLSFFYSSRATFLTSDLCSWKSLPWRTINGHISITVLDRCMITMDHR